MVSGVCAHLFSDLVGGGGDEVDEQRDSAMVDHHTCVM